MPKFCTVQCRHLRSVRYGFDGRPVVGAHYDRRDTMATCALNQTLQIVPRMKPICAMEGER
jgi:hypothetical protein